MLIVGVPSLLLVDYGSYFITYLSGSGKSTSITVEFTFDYIALSIFYLRLIVQNVRLIFMMFAFTELHEILVFNRIEFKYSFIDDLVLASKNGYWYLFKNAHYYLFMMCGAIAH